MSNVKRQMSLAAVAFVLAASLVSAQSPAWLEDLRAPSARLVAESQRTDFAWQRLAELTDTFGPRLSGSLGLERAIDWAVATMKADGLDNVRTEPVMVPKWVRGRESLQLLSPIPQPLPMLGLGNSVGTGPNGLTADVIVIRNFDDLEARSAEVKGKIVLYNVPYTTYGETVPYRQTGPARAARHGAVGVLVRSVGPVGLRTPHTGNTTYTPNVPAIPAAAIPVEDAERFQRLQNRGVPIRVTLTMEARMEGEVQSFNVIGELRGRERPEELVVVGCHFDSWDVGAGASDDGGGCIVTWEALRLMKVLGLRPRRTVRVVLWTNEENGLRGGNAYRDAHMDELKNHVLLLESDGGVFDPAGFGFTGPDNARAAITAIASLLKGIGADRIAPSGGGADIGPAGQAGNIPMMSHLVGGDYFLIHHTHADTVDRITPKQMSDNAAAIAVIAFGVAEMRDRLTQVK